MITQRKNGGYTMRLTYWLSKDEKEFLDKVCKFFHCDDSDFYRFAVALLSAKALEFMQDHEEDDDEEKESFDLSLLDEYFEAIMGLFY